MSRPGKPNYAPVPLRAIRDSRLSERHLRTLMVIAAHDRLGANGIGCYASHGRLSKLIGCDYSRLSTNLKELGECGYVERVQHPLNKRLRVYRVVYTDEDKNVLKADRSDAPISDSLPTGNANPAENCGKPDVNIFRETGNTSHINEGRDTPEGASLCSDARSANEEFGMYLRKIERALKAGICPENATAWQSASEDITEVVETRDFDDALLHWGERLIGEIEDELINIGWQA